MKVKRKKTTKDKNGENPPRLYNIELILINWNVVNNDNQQISKVLYTFVPNKTFGKLLKISPKASMVFEKN